jgi:hypothetical protein
MERADLGSKHSSDGPVGFGPADSSYTEQQRAVVDYIRSMTAELSSMAATARLPLLAYLLDMVQLESEAIISRDPVSRARPATSAKRGPAHGRRDKA